MNSTILNQVYASNLTASYRLKLTTEGQQLKNVISGNNVFWCLV
jgi:hypothetical protein